MLVCCFIKFMRLSAVFICPQPISTVLSASGIGMHTWNRVLKATEGQGQAQASVGQNLG